MMLLTATNEEDRGKDNGKKGGVVLVDEPCLRYIAEISERATA